VTHLSKHLEDAVALVSTLPTDQQNLIALEITERAHALARAPIGITPRERSELETELAAARRGELASDAEVAALFAKFGL
jgi:hypothetical protein